MKRAAIFLAFVTSAIALVLVTVGHVGVSIKRADQVGQAAPVSIGAAFVFTFAGLFVLGALAGGAGWAAYRLWRKLFGPGRG